MDKTAGWIEEIWMQFPAVPPAVWPYTSLCCVPLFVFHKDEENSILNLAEKVLGYNHSCWTGISIPWWCSLLSTQNKSLKLLTERVLQSMMHAICQFTRHFWVNFSEIICTCLPKGDWQNLQKAFNGQFKVVPKRGSPDPDSCESVTQCLIAAIHPQE